MYTYLSIPEAFLPPDETIRPLSPKSMLYYSLNHSRMQTASSGVI